MSVILDTEKVSMTILSLHRRWRMPKLEWSERLDLGVERVDDQHKKLVALANKLLVVIKKSAPKRELTTIFQISVNTPSTISMTKRSTCI
jgi:hypothetical protein